MPSQPPANLRSATLLHGFLTAGVFLIVVVFGVLFMMGIVPLLGDESDPSGAQLIGYTLTGVGAVLLAVSLLMLKPRVPPVPPGQTMEGHWAMPAVNAAASLVWFLLDGAGVISAVGFFLAGELVSIVVAAAALIALATSGPSQLTKDQNR